MACLLLDTDVLIDLFQRRIPALAWFASLTEQPTISFFSMLEMLGGCRDKQEYRMVEQFLSAFNVVNPNEKVFRIAIEEFTPYCLSHGVGYMDVLIASLAKEQGLQLVSKNLKHFKPLPGLNVVRPYL